MYNSSDRFVFFIILFTFTISVVFITFTYLMTSTCNDERGKENGMDTLFYHIFSLFISISPQEHRRRLVRIISVWWLCTRGWDSGNLRLLCLFLVQWSLGGPQNQAEGARNFAFDFETEDLRILIGQTTVVAVNLTIYAKVWKREFWKVESSKIIIQN